MNTKDNVFDRQLANTSFYAALNYDPTESITQEINTFIKKMFSDAEIGNLCFQLPPQYTHEVRFYLLPQINNKANLRDLIAATGLVILLKLNSNRWYLMDDPKKQWGTSFMLL